MHDFSLKLDKRTLTGKKVKKLREQGHIPSVVYGAKQEAINSQSPQVETEKIVKEAGKHSPVNLTIDGKKKLAIIKNIDIDPVKRGVRHIDFHLIRKDEIIHAEVPIILTGEGESAAERAGLVVLQAIEKVEIKAKPADLPESLEISIVNLVTTDDKITISDVVLPEGVEFAEADQDMELVIANVYEPSALQAANEAAGGDAEEDTEVPSEKGAEEESEESSEDEGGEEDKKPSESDSPESESEKKSE